MNKVKMIVDKNNLTVKFECEGDIWKWLKKVKNRNRHNSQYILYKVLEEEIESFFYESKLNKYIRRFKDEDIEIIEGELEEGKTQLQVHCGA